MLQLTEQQIQKRFDSLPKNIRDALTSEINTQTILQICQSHYLDEEKTSIIEQLAGLTLLGFVSQEEIKREISENLNLKHKHSEDIAREIDRKIFAPIRMDLEKIYSPVSAMPEIKPPTKRPEPEVKIELEKEIKIEKDGIKIEKEPEPKPAPFPIAPTTPTIPTPVVPTTPVPAEKPFILQQETEAKPVGEKKRGAPPIIGWFRKAMPTGRQEKPEPPIKVELETLGPKIEERKEPIVAKTEAPKQKVIHYREVEMPTPFGKPFGKAQGEAQGEPFGKPAAQPPKETQPPKPAMPAATKTEPPKPFDDTQGKPFGETQGKPEEPKVISLDSFEAVEEKDKQLL